MIMNQNKFMERAEQIISSMSEEEMRVCLHEIARTTLKKSRIAFYSSSQNIIMTRDKKK